MYLTIICRKTLRKIEQRRFANGKVARINNRKIFLFGNGALETRVAMVIN